MKKLLLLAAFLIGYLLLAGCGPSAEEFTCAEDWLRRAKEQGAYLDEESIARLDEALEAAEARDQQGVLDAAHAFIIGQGAAPLPSDDWDRDDYERATAEALAGAHVGAALDCFSNLRAD